MHNNPETTANSAKAVAELNKKREAKELRQQTVEQRTEQNESVKIALLNKANELAVLAHMEAQESKAESLKSSRRALWSNVIATASFIIAFMSLVYAYVSNNT